MTLLPPLTLYIHIPFCRRKCPYCDFGSHVMARIPEQRYLEALKWELARHRHQRANDTRPLTSLFFGGGTPSLLRGTTIKAIVAHVMALWPLSDPCEITLEANPESATRDKMDRWREGGINRLSLGVQALDATRLALLGRPHDLPTAHRAIQQAQQVGFEAINLDLIYATPGHTPAMWRRELAEAMAWAPHHLSCYQLSIEPDTPFDRRHRRDPAWRNMTEHLELSLFQQTWETLSQGGWPPYETSNFARATPSTPAHPPPRWPQGSDTHVCIHNKNYWSFGDYLGIGSGAHSKWSTPGEGGAPVQTWRHANTRSVTDYLARQEARAEAHAWQPISATAAGEECLLMGLRHNDGVRHARYHAVTGEDLRQRRATAIAPLVDAGYLTLDAESLRLTERGMPLADAITQQLA